MKRFFLLRISSNTESTIGALFYGDTKSGEFRCFTLEDQKQEVKVPRETRIPQGTYKIKLRTAGAMSKKYSDLYAWHQHGMLWLQDVPGFEWIYLHPGNTDADTEGCILVGDKPQQNITKRGRLEDSVMTYKRIYKEITELLLAGEEVEITIGDFA